MSMMSHAPLPVSHSPSMYWRASSLGKDMQSLTAGADSCRISHRTGESGELKESPEKIPALVGPRAVLVKPDHGLFVLGDFFRLVQIERTCQLLQIDDVRQIGFRETQHRECPALPGMTTEAEGHHLKSDIRLLRHVDQVPQLSTHHFPPAVGTAECRLVQHGVEAGGALGDERLLPGQPQRDPAVDLGGRRTGHSPGYDGMRVRL